MGNFPMILFIGKNKPEAGFALVARAAGARNCKNKFYVSFFF